MTDRKTGNAHLIILADALETVPEEQFDYHQWVGSGWTGDETLSCGTKACALGWATTIPKFRELGLCMRKVTYLRFDGTTDLQGLVGLTHNEDAGETEAGNEIFGLNEDEFDYLFTPDACKDYGATAKDVAQKIRRFVSSDHELVGRVESSDDYDYED